MGTNDGNFEITVDSSNSNLINRHRKWWEKQGILVKRSNSQPLGPLRLPLADGSLAEIDLELKPKMLDLDLLGGQQLSPGSLEIDQDFIQTRAPYGQLPWLEAILGGKVWASIESGGMRSIHSIIDWDQLDIENSLYNPEWLTLIKKLTTLLVQRSGGRFAVTAPTLRGPSDLAEALLGPELMIYTMFDHPEKLRGFLEVISERFILVLRELLEIIPRIYNGYVNPFGIWAPGTVVRTQCDATAFLSSKQYRDWFLPYDVKISEAFDYSIIHLHSCSLHVIDDLLMISKPMAIQITLEDEPKGPSLENLLPTFQRILESKPLLLEGKISEDQLSLLLENLPHAGLAINARKGRW